MSYKHERDQTVVTPSTNKVDEAAGGTVRQDNLQELKALKMELRELREASWRQATGVATSQRSVREEVEFQIRRKPIMALGVAAVAGFIYGIAR